MLYHPDLPTLNMGPRPFRPKEIDGLLVPPGKASTQLTDHLITGLLLRFEPAQEKWLSQTHHTNKP